MVWSAQRRRAYEYATVEASPIAVYGGLASIIASVVWVIAFQPDVHPTLTVEAPSWAMLLVTAALMLGTLLGVRILIVLRERLKIEAKS